VIEVPVAWCPKCSRDAIVHRCVADGEDPLSADLQVRCVDCDTRLDRFGLEPDVRQRPLEALVADGYVDLDKPPPIGRGGCFESRGCEGCSKIDSRPW